MRFAGDWSGVFVRGDDAHRFATALDSMLRRRTGESAADEIDPLNRAVLVYLRDALLSSDERGELRGLQEMRPFDEAKLDAAESREPEAET